MNSLLHKNNIDCIMENECMGCMLCMSVCEKHAISTFEDREGFKYPIVDETQCINCGKCLKMCPAINTSVFSENIKIYALQGDDVIRKNSSSGGAFSMLADKFLRNGGVVFGAELNDGNLRHVMISIMEELCRVQKSKYIQSDISDCYRKIKLLLDDKQKVMFVGTPCQCEAVANYCNNNELLYLVDILCMGVPSQRLFNRYLDEELGDIKNFCFRDKEQDDWGCASYFSYEKEGKKYRVSFDNSSYFKAFLEGYSLRKSCYLCKYANKMRISDITIGDFWGIEQYYDEFSDKKGTSMVLVSSEKGEALLKEITGVTKKEIKNNDVIKNNQAMVHPTRDRGKRKEFFCKIENESLENVVYELSNNKADCGIINWWWEDDNGAILTAYALQQTLRSLNYSSRLIDFKTDSSKYGISDEFAKKYLYVTSPIVNDQDYRKLNESFGAFIVGSDQVFRAEWVSDHWFLDFVEKGKKKIAVSASFGTKQLNVSKLRKSKIEYLLSRFDSISVRERSGVGLCNELGVDANYIIDPVFYLEKNDYIQNFELKNNNDNDNEKYIFVYIRDASKGKEKIIEKISQNLGISNFFYADNSTEVEIFLGKLLHSSFVVSDSYHGICFSLIFNKRYLCIVNKMRGSERFNELIYTFSLCEKNFVYEVDETFDYSLIKIDTNWIEINEIIKVERARAIAWIEKALAKRTKTNRIKTSIKKYRYEKMERERKQEGIKKRKKRLLYWKENINKVDSVICFGAGLYGEKYIQKNNNVAFFLDNKKDLYWIEKYPVYSIDDVIDVLDKNKKIVITTSKTYQNEIKKQLINCGFKNIENYSDF